VLTAVCQQRRGAPSNGRVRRQTLIEACAQGFGRFRIPLPQGFQMKRLKTLRQATEYALYIIDISSIFGS